MCSKFIIRVFIALLKKRLLSGALATNGEIKDELWKIR